MQRVSKFDQKQFQRIFTNRQHEEAPHFPLCSIFIKGLMDLSNALIRQDQMSGLLHIKAHIVRAWVVRDEKKMAREVFPLINATIGHESQLELTWLLCVVAFSMVFISGIIVLCGKSERKPREKDGRGGRQQQQRGQSCWSWHFLTWVVVVVLLGLFVAAEEGVVAAVEVGEAIAVVMEVGAVAEVAAGAVASANFEVGLYKHKVIMTY